MCRHRRGRSSVSFNPVDTTAIFEGELGPENVIHRKVLASRDPGYCETSLGAGIVLLALSRYMT